MATTITFGNTKLTRNTLFALNLMEENLSGLLDAKVPNLQKLIDMGLYHFYYTNLKSETTDEDINVLKALRAMNPNVRISLFYKITDGDIANANAGKAMDFTLLDKMIAICNPLLVEVDQESAGTDRTKNQVPDAPYVNIAQQVIDHCAKLYPTIEVFVDGALPYKVNKEWINRGTSLKNIKGARGTRTYMQYIPDRLPGDPSKPVPTDLNVIAAGMDIYFTTTLQNDYYSTVSLQDYRGIPSGIVPRYSNFTQVAILQMHARDASRTASAIDGRPLENLFYGRISEFIMNHTGTFRFCAYMALGNLFERDGSLSPVGESLKRLLPLYTKYKYVQPMTFGMTGVTGLHAWNDPVNGVTDHCILVNNKTTAENNIPASALGPVSGAITYDRGWAAAQSDAVKNENGSEAQITIKSLMTGLFPYKTTSPVV